MKRCHDLDVEYFINEEKKVVVAKIFGCYNGLYCDLCNAGYPDVNIDYLEDMDDAVVGKATCSPDDVFDVEIGKKIAFKRAYMKYTRQKIRALNNYMKGFNEFIKEFTEDTNKLLDNYSNAIVRREKEIQTLIG